MKGASIPHPAVVTSVNGNKIGLVPISHTKVSKDHSEKISNLVPSVSSLSGHGFLGATTADIKHLKPATGALAGKSATSQEVSDLINGMFDGSANVFLRSDVSPNSTKSTHPVRRESSDCAEARYSSSAFGRTTTASLSVFETF
jgi:hypothetical protein